MDLLALIFPLIILGCVLGNELATRRQIFDDANNKGQAVSYQSIEMSGVSYSHKHNLKNFQPQELPQRYEKNDKNQQQELPQRYEKNDKNHLKLLSNKTPSPINVDNKSNFKQQFTPPKFSQDFKPSTFIPQKPEPYLTNKKNKKNYQPKHIVKNPLLSKKPMRVVKRRIKIEGSAPYIYHPALHRLILSSILSSPPHLTRK